jgi:hypothetical protein
VDVASIERAEGFRDLPGREEHFDDVRIEMGKLNSMMQSVGDLPWSDEAH